MYDIYFSVNKLNLYFPFAVSGTKDQLSALTNNIKGNANVVRTKLKSELRTSFLHCTLQTLIW